MGELRGAFGAALFEARRMCGMSAEQFAHEVNCGRNTIWRWENAKALPNPEKFDSLLKVCEKKGIDTYAIKNAYSYALTHVNN